MIEIFHNLSSNSTMEIMNDYVYKNPNETILMKIVFEEMCGIFLQNGEPHHELLG